ncbi:MAG: MFS transporter [Muribaculum sp.]|nr:MFS transporter [Muribaculaceae bacterium]MCM1081475.1 MFS transporter [Muribaculum sp.]
MNAIKSRLAILCFLQFAVWGSYLVCLGQYLSKAGLGADISLFYSVQGFVSIFMPAVMGIIADRWVPAQRLLGICHLLAAAFMFAAWQYAQQHTLLEFGPFFGLYTLSVAFYMPTIALTNSVSFSVLKSSGLDTVKDFPPIRVLGTVGFIAAMWFVNCAYYFDGSFGFTVSDATEAAGMRFQYTSAQLLVSAVLGLMLALYTISLPNVPVNKSAVKTTWTQTLGLDAFKLFRDSRMFIFFTFSLLLGVALQITNGYATPFISSFKGTAEFANTFGANNSTLLTSISQISEAFCILLIPFFLQRFGIKKVMLIAMLAWVFRFGLFAVGNPGSGVWLLILSMIVYGVAFDFFNVSGALFVEQETHNSIKASAQGLFMLMTNGLGASIGMLMAGAVVNHFITVSEQGYMVGNWTATWTIFAVYAALVALMFQILFKYKHNPNKA